LRKRLNAQNKSLWSQPRSYGLHEIKNGPKLQIDPGHKQWAELIVDATCRFIAPHREGMRRRIKRQVKQLVELSRQVRQFKSEMINFLAQINAEWNAVAHPFHWTNQSFAKVMAKCENPEEPCLKVAA
jgi:hypothetical protein